jgi:TonB family protein
MAEKKLRRKMLATLFLLLVTLAVILLKDRAIWFGAEQTLNEEESQESLPTSVAQAPPPTSLHAAESAPSSVKQLPSTRKPANAKNSLAVNGSAEPATTVVIASAPIELPAIEVEVVAGDTHRKVRPGNNSVKVEMGLSSGSRAGSVTTFDWSPATNAAETTRIASDQPDIVSRPVRATYPSLAPQMKVAGSVLLQALVRTDGTVENLRVLSGNPILISAALEAARQWRFAPHLQNGQPVETEAKIIVNFAIKVL